MYDFLAAFGLVFVIEGLIFAALPLHSKRAMASVLETPDASLRLIGIGSAVLHPESSRVARMASGGRHGFAQSLFQVGGNVGSAIGPLLAAFVVLRYGQSSVAWFSIAALLGIFLLLHVGRWYRGHGLARLRSHAMKDRAGVSLPRVKLTLTIVVLIALIFSKFFYMASMTSYYTFYLIDQFQVSVSSAQVHLFVFLAAVAIGTIAGGSPRTSAVACGRGHEKSSARPGFGGRRSPFSSTRK